VVDAKATGNLGRLIETALGLEELAQLLFGPGFVPFLRNPTLEAWRGLHETTDEKIKIEV
jgi:hypothetical protein